MSMLVAVTGSCPCLVRGKEPGPLYGWKDGSVVESAGFCRGLESGS